MVTTTNPFGSTVSVTDASTREQTAALQALVAAPPSISPIPHVDVTTRPSDTFTTQSGAGLLTAPRPEASPVAAAVAKGIHLMEVVDAEYGAIDVDAFTADLLQDLCLEANTHKKALAKVEDKLVILDTLNTVMKKPIFSILRKRTT